VKSLRPINSCLSAAPTVFRRIGSTTSRRATSSRDPNGGDAHGFVTGKEIAWAISRCDDVTAKSDGARRNGHRPVMGEVYDHVANVVGITVSFLKVV
jgi:hypothetical protein